MRTVLLRLTTLAAVLVPLSPPVLRAQEGIFVTDFSLHAPAQASYPLAGPAKVRRGVTSTVVIVKNLIDLVPFDQIKVHSGPTTIAGLTNGRTLSSGTGFIQMSMTVPAGVTAGSTVTLDVGFLDHFNFTVEREGLLTQNPVFNPVPSTVVAGTPIVITLAGTDLGTPEISTLLCHNIVKNSTLTFTATRTSTSTCITNNGPFGFNVRGTGSGDPTTEATATGTTRFTYPAYLVPPPTPGLTCASVPNIAAPVITRPTNQQLFTFGTGANTRQNLSVVWLKKTQQQELAPNNDWLVTLEGTTTTVRDTVFSHAYAVPGSYTVSVRAKNCDTSAGSSSVTFALKFQ